MMNLPDLPPPMPSSDDESGEGTTCLLSPCLLSIPYAQHQRQYEMRKFLTKLCLNRSKSSEVASQDGHKMEQATKVVEEGWEGFKIALRILKESSGPFPPLRAAVGGLLEIIEVIDRTSDNKEKFTSIAERIKNLSDVIKKYDEPSTPQHVQNRIEGLAQSIDRRTEFIQKRLQSGSSRRFFNSSKDEGEIDNTLYELSFAVGLFQIDTVLSVEAQTRYNYESEILKILGAVSGAAYYENSRSGCMEGTRVDTLSKLLSWAIDPGSPSVFWLNGMAGTGKSAIAKTLCKLLDASNQADLGGSFFCSRQSESLNKVCYILPTIADQLARRHGTYRDALVKVLLSSTRGSFSSATLQEQAKQLFSISSEVLRGRPVVVVIDALDECSISSAVTDLIRVILRAGFPSNLKVFLTGRPETHLYRGFSSEKSLRIDDELFRDAWFRQHSIDPSLLQLHDIEADIVREDITRYIKSELSYVSEYNERWPSDRDVEKLATKSGKLFIFAFTAIKFLSSGDNLPLNARQARLASLLTPTSPQSSGLQTAIIDELYRQIFDSAYRDKLGSEIESLRLALDTVICLQEPQSISTAAQLLNQDVAAVRTVLGNFSSVLSVPEDNSSLVLTFHASFPDFLLDQSRSGFYSLKYSEHHQYLALKCLKLMNQCLRQDICDIKTRKTRNSNIPKDRVQEHIPPELRYACVFWSSHLDIGQNDANQRTDLTSELGTFVNEHILHWFECLSLMQMLHVAVSCLQTAINSLSKVTRNKALGEILHDAQRMLPQSYHFLKSHALAAYVSGLAWLPEASALREQYGSGKGFQVVCGLQKEWDSCEQVLQNDSDVISISFSPDGFKLASGSWNYAVRIWNLETGETIKVLEGHTKMVTSVAFSPDGSKLASGSRDETVRIWNVKTGETAKVLKGHTDFVSSVAFSPDGSKLASGSWNKTVRIWNVETGETAKVLEGHTEMVTSVAFSLDGSKLASGSDDQTVRIWNVETGETAKVLEDHTEMVTSVAFSPDGSKLASGSRDETVRIWNVKTGETAKVLEGHTEMVTSVAFSLDGSKLASGSSDETVRIWNVETGETSKVLEGHTNRVRSVAFSPDGSKLASGSDDNTVRIWNVETGETSKVLEGHTNRVRSVAFSPDGSKLASGSDDNTVRIWNLENGETAKVLQGHTGWINSVEFSPDGSKLSSGSPDKTVRIWNVETGETAKVLEGHTEWVTSVAFSPDGSKLASGSHDKTMRIWNLENGETAKVLQGHTGWINSVEFSPDGSKLASGSSDSTVRIWNVETGETAKVLEGHTDIVYSVAFSPDGSKLASGSGDKTVRIWNVETGETVKVLGHTYWVHSVAFSPDGSNVAAGSWDYTVRIWNVETGEAVKTLESNDESFQFSDSTQIRNTGLGNFEIVPTSTVYDSFIPYNISKEDGCVTSTTAEGVERPVLWIWRDYLNDIREVAFSQTHGCFGYESGRVVIFKLS